MRKEKVLINTLISIVKRMKLVALGVICSNFRPFNLCI